MHDPHVEMLHHSCEREQQKATECDASEEVLFWCFFTFLANS